MLKPDTFSEYRILGFPPGVSALLISFNRFHNYVAENLKQINEGGRFCLNPSLSKDTAEKVTDNALFNTARLYVTTHSILNYLQTFPFWLKIYFSITCGLYVNIILSDYVKTILNMNYSPDTSWVLDPRGSYSDIFKNNTEFPMGTGNQVSAEFNLIYRWHGNLSVKDEVWTQAFMQDLFPGQVLQNCRCQTF